MFKVNTASFPLYELRSYNNKIVEGGVTLVETYTGMYILDDKNKPGNTLGERRLRINPNYLYKFKSRIDSVSQLIKLKTGTKVIDSIGAVYTYKKSRMIQFSCYEPRSIRKISDGYLIKVIGIKREIFYKYLDDLPVDFIKYVIIGKINNGYLIYGFSDIYIEDFKKKI